MDGRQKSTLRHYQVKLADELILDEDFYAALRQRKLFTDQMIGQIKAEATEKDRIYRVIKLLPKRGPDAFEKFVEILRENFAWLAEMLEEGYAEMCQAKDTTDCPDEGQVDQTRTVPNSHHNRISSFEPPSTKTRKKAYQTQYSYPTSYHAHSENSTPRFFPKDFSHDFADAGVSCIQGTGRGTKDACVSPILTIESPRKTTSAHQRSMQRYERRDNVHRIDHTPVVTDNETDDTDDEDVVDGCPSMTANTLNSVEVNSVENERTNNTDDENNDQTLEDDTEFLHPKLMLVDTVTNIDPQKSQLKDTSTSEGQSRSEDKIIQDPKEDQKELMGNIYNKLAIFIDENKLVYDAHGFKQSVRDRPNTENGLDISLEMINELVEELTDMPIKEHVGVVEKCYNLVDTKDRKLPLNMCIDNLNEEIKDLKKRLSEEEKKSNEMADDMYKHSQEMKKLNKLIARERHLVLETKSLKDKCEELEKIQEENIQTINTLQNQVTHFQKYKDQDNEYGESRREEKKGVKKTNPVTRRLSLTTVNRKPGQYPSSEPRLFAQKSSYSSRAPPPRGHVSTLRSKKP